ncbi:MAG TPA: tetratricopeptide repeat protein [Kofleriaceae bacterium]
MSVHRQRAQAAAELKRWDTVITEAKLAIGEEPREAAGYAFLAHALHANGEGKAAFDAANEGIAVAPQSEWLHRLRAAICNDQGAHDAALASVTESLRLAPENASGHGLAAKIYNNRKDPVRARAAIKRALELDADVAWLHRTAGDTELATNPTEAERHYREAVRIDPRDAVAVNNLGVALERLGRDDEAALAYRSAVLLDPTMSVAKRNAHSSVQRMTVPGRVIAGGVGAGALGLKFLFAGQMCAHTTRMADHTDDTIWYVLGIIGALLVAVVAVRGWLRHEKRVRQEHRVREAYPELWVLYQQLEKDRRRGKL